VNKDIPMMHCNGKCVLSKKLNEQQKQDQQVPVPKNERFDIAPFFLPKTFELPVIASRIKTLFFIKNDDSLSSISASIFHPPSA
jgi:hypothetical protein